MTVVTWQQKRQLQEPMRQQLEQQAPMRQQRVLEQVRLQVLALVLGLLFCRKRTKQQQR
jgi:sensor domain CHASE-containing protein